MVGRDLRGSLVLILVLLIGIGVVASPFFLPEPSRLRIEVSDGVFNIRPSRYGRVPVVQLIDERDGEQFSLSIVATEKSDTIFLEKIPSGRADLRLLITGFEPKEFEVDLIPLKTNEVSVQLEPLFGRVKVVAVNARTNEIREGTRVAIDNIGEESSESVLLLPPGEHSISVREEGFCAAKATVDVRPRDDKTIRFPMSPELGTEEAARVTLTWNREPRDLDIHLLYDSTDIDDPHVYFGKREGFIKSGHLFAELDIDHLQPGGTETITLYQRALGTSHIFINQFAGSSSLGESDALIEVFQRDCKHRVYSIARDCERRWYHAFDIGIRHLDAELSDIGQCLRENPGFVKRLTNGK